MQTRQKDAIDAAIALMNIVRQIRDAENQYIQWAADNSVKNWPAIWQQMPTAAVNADGTPGQPDASTVIANPITIPLTDPLYRSPYQLGALKSFMEDFQLFLNNQAVSAFDRGGLMRNGV